MTITSFAQNLASFFLQSMDILQPCGSHISDAQSIKLTFSLKITSILQNLKTELKNLQHSFHAITLSKGTIFAKNAELLQVTTSEKLKGPGTNRYFF